MACAKCDFYAPKDSGKAQLLEARANLQKMRTVIPLTEDEQAAVDDGSAALDRLLDRLADPPTPGGPTSRQIGAPAAAPLPVVEVNRKPTQQRSSAAQPVPDVIRLGPAGLDAVLIETVSDTEAARTAEGELHRHSPCRQIAA